MPALQPVVFSSVVFEEINYRVTQVRECSQVLLMHGTCSEPARNNVVHYQQYSNSNIIMGLRGILCLLVNNHSDSFLGNY